MLFTTLGFEPWFKIRRRNKRCSKGRNQYDEVKVEDQQRKREREAQSKTVGPSLKGGRDAPVVKRRWKACAGNRQLGR